MQRNERLKLFLKTLSERILVLDGATGTALQSKNLTPKDFGGVELDGCNENLVFTRPDVVASVHDLYLDVGADIVETNSFGGAAIVLAEYNLQDKAYEINFRAAKIARERADAFTAKNPSKPRFVAGSMGPTTKALSVTGGISFEELEQNYFDQAHALYEGGIDYFLLETCNDTRNIKAGLLGIRRFLETQEVKLPIAVSVTIEATGTMLAGQSIDALAASLSHQDLLYVGLNCATGPDLMTDHIRTLSDMLTTRVACVPNAGLPNEHGKYLETPAMVASVLERFVDQGWINLIGGCCGTNQEHIRAMAKMVEGKKPRTPKTQMGSWLSGVDFLDVTDEKRPLLVGERSNVIGSKKFKDLITAKLFDEAAEMAKDQVKKGAHVVDVCLANPDSNEYEDMKNFLEKVIHKVRAPLMIDTTDDKVVALGLSYSQGKAIINSINLEDGEERYKKIVPLAKKFNAALVVGTIDDDKENGMAVTRERKLEVAKRSYDLLVNKFGYPEEDIYFDPLVFPCATGDEKYVGSAQETIEGIRLIKKTYPRTKSAIGVSNVSFGLPPAGREVLNSVFLYHCTQAGLDLAIVNTEKLRRFSSLTPEEIQLSEDLIFNRHPKAIDNFVAAFRDKKASKEVKSHADLSIPERLKLYIIEGTKKGMVEDLNEQLKVMKPLDIINGPLMEGMAEVGKLFNANKLIVAEVLQSAESMKAAVNHLEQFMSNESAAKKGKMVLATVKGDVHDIGKNLVDIVLSNNGYEVINLGIKIGSEQLIEAIKEHKPDMVGLSGLLVKSALQMATTAEDMKNAGITTPVICGGAALSRNFVRNKVHTALKNGPALYAKDAMDGLRLANLVMNKTEFTAFLKEWNQLGDGEVPAFFKGPDLEKDSTTPSKLITTLDKTPEAPNFERHLAREMPMEEIFGYINPLMLYGKHLGVNGKYIRLYIEKNLADLKSTPEGLKALEIFEEVRKVFDTYKESHLKGKAVYQFYKCSSEGNTIHLHDENNVKLKNFVFPRQKKENGLCLSDYVLPIDDMLQDNLALFVVTVGQGIKEKVLELKNEGKFLHSHILSALALELAEASAEFLHEKLRDQWKISDPEGMTMAQKHQAQYQGKRYSFGYPACPVIEDQKALFELLRPEEIGVQLTEGSMMDPEASVSAMVFHHPQATYFSVRGEES